MVGNPSATYFTSAKLRWDSVSPVAGSGHVENGKLENCRDL